MSSLFLKSVVKLTGHLLMTIAFDLGVIPQTKQNADFCNCITDTDLLNTTAIVLNDYLNYSGK